MTLSLLEQGISAAQSGQRDRARDLLTQAVQTDERNEEAWIWLAGMVDDPEDMRTCLENALHLSPSNAKAQQGLAWVEQRYGARPVVEPAPVPAPQPAPQSMETISALLNPPELLPQVPAPAPETTVLPPGSTTYRSLNERPITSAADPFAEVPCIYCGAAMRLKQKRCPECGKSQMFRAPAEPHKGSKAMTFLAWCWSFPVLVGFIVIIVTVGIGLMEGRGRAGGPNLLFVIIGLIIVIALYALLCAPALLLARGLYRCRRLAFIIQTILATLELVGCTILLFALVKFPSIATTMLNDPAMRQRSFFLSSPALFWAMIVGSVGWRVLIIVLLWFGYGAVYGRKSRLLPTVKVSGESYNNGLDYRKRGMWYMAIQEWEAAVIRSPRELEYLHTLGLGYAQIKQFDRARAMLDSALQLAPSDSRIADSRALIAQLEQGQRRW